MISAQEARELIKHLRDEETILTEEDIKNRKELIDNTIKVNTELAIECIDDQIRIAIKKLKYGIDIYYNVVCNKIPSNYKDGGNISKKTNYYIKTEINSKLEQYYKEKGYNYEFENPKENFSKFWINWKK